jgi:hypothetical protein
MQPPGKGREERDRDARRAYRCRFPPTETQQAQESTAPPPRSPTSFLGRRDIPSSRFSPVLRRAEQCYVPTVFNIKSPITRGRKKKEPDLQHDQMRRNQTLLLINTLTTDPFKTPDKHTPNSKVKLKLQPAKRTTITRMGLQSNQCGVAFSIALLQQRFRELERIREERLLQMLVPRPPPRRGTTRQVLLPPGPALPMQADARHFHCQRLQKLPAHGGTVAQQGIQPCSQ